MTQTVWQVIRTVTDVTAQIMSMTYSTGRRTQFDSWSPGYLNLTIKNDTGQADNYELNEEVQLRTNLIFKQTFFVQEILYNDLGNDGQGSTATIICADLLGRMGRIQVFEESIASAKTLTQIKNEFESLMPTGVTIEISGTGASTAAADASYTGTALNRLNLNMVTEQGWLAVANFDIWLYGRDDIDDLGASITFARTASGSFQFAYSDIKRIALGPNYLNNCTVTPPVAAAQNAKKPSGITAYGTYGAEFATVDNTAAQAKSFAQWQVESRNDPDELSFEISLSDTANDLEEFFQSVFDKKPLVTVSYKNPGDSTTFTDTQIMQGFTMTITPSRTDLQVFTSPLTYTQFFKLNSATFGKLNTSKLGW